MHRSYHLRGQTH